jgi:uncharacterized protein (DUF4415 family)
MGSDQGRVNSTAERLVTLGRDYLDRLVLVIWTWRGENIRVISAREPTARSDGSIWRDQMRKKYDFTKAKRGAVAPASTGKTRITIRLDNDILVWFREQVHAAGGGNYQTLINQALRRVIEEGEEPLETVMRRIVREEIQRLPRYSRGRSSRGA